MRLKRFQKASELAYKSKTWNNNEVAGAINERLQFEREEQIEIGFGNLLDSFAKADARLPAHKDLKFDNPMLGFLSYVEAGYYPPPDALVAISKCFSSYLEARGARSLDEAFFGQAHGTRKSYAYKHSKEGYSSEYVLFDRWFEIQDNLSQEKAAEKFLNLCYPDKNIDVDSFLRSYRRYLSGQKSKVLS